MAPIIIQMRNLKLKEVKEPSKVRQTPGVNGSWDSNPGGSDLGPGLSMGTFEGP